jgi:ComF family protein
MTLVAILDLLFPPACSGCGTYGQALCTRCRGAFRPASTPRDRFVAPDPAVVVGDELEVALAAFAYEGVLRRTLSRLKYGSAARLARPLAEAAAPLLAPLVLQHAGATLVPVPVHRDRLRQRGYNQAALLARQLARELGLPTADVLARARPTGQQHRLNRAERLRNLHGAFAVRADARAPPRAILVDDILTTSATLEACAATLRESGCERVVGVAIAREL